MRIIYKGTAPKKHRKAIAAFAAGNYKLAKKEWETIDDNIALKGLAFIALKESQYREARSFFNDLLSSAALDPEVRNGLAVCHLAEGKTPEAIHTLLEGLEETPAPLLKTTLERIRTAKGEVPLTPLMVITLPSLGFNPLGACGAVFKKMGIHVLWIAIPLLALLLFWGYPYLRNFSLSLNLRSRAASLPVKASVIGLNEIMAARQNSIPDLNPEEAGLRAAELRTLISEGKLNRARILANRILASNAPEGIKERVLVLEGFIAEPEIDNIDYIPSYKEIASAPSFYKGVVVRWEGTAANLRHRGRSKTTFDLLIGYEGGPQVQGIAAVELSGMQELANGSRLTVVGLYQGITSDNRVMIQASRIIP